MMEKSKCKKCEELEKEFFRTNPDKRGRVMCLECFEEYKGHTVYVTLPFHPVIPSIERCQVRPSCGGEKKECGER